MDEKQKESIGFNDNICKSGKKEVSRERKFVNFFRGKKIKNKEWTIKGN